ncbi:hypothetical protein [Pyxidicoccus sp. MSG2]|uniref:SitA5 family polymorphic toxin n=1 Tax=Pyxidicoccus sp. MSG2 TaxID=2996790 RepID=UPI002270E5A8|nr:hypothetical protein [Pyxidicoccus sp. MSG2]MCY1017875.1 hypothetical protein [Pyxidicoccus sp. MSG2]
MTPRQVGAVMLMLLAACSGVPRVTRASLDDGEVGAGAARYGLSVFSARTVSDEPVEVDEDDFTEAVAKLAREARPVAQPQAEARRLFAETREAQARVDGERVIRLAPVNVSAAASRAEAELTREYLRWCQRMQGGGDCLRLLVDGPTVRGDDRYALALAISLGSVLAETTQALKGMVQPSAVLSLLVWTAVVYLLLWALPDPLSKTIAAGMTVLLLGWLGVDTLWSLMRGWVCLVEDSDRATTFDELSEAGETFGRVMGENTARVLVMVATTALGGAMPKLAKLMPKLPGFTQAAVQAEAQGGLRLASVAEVESVAVSSEGTFSVLMKSPGRQAGAAAAESEDAATTIIRHQGGNRQVLTNGQRWHVPTNKPLKDIPTADPVGDQLQAAATRVAGEWGPHRLTRQERDAIGKAAARGEQWLVRLLERQARGRFLEKVLRRQFPQLRWSPKGVDAVDPSTGYKYELLSGTDSNLALHGTRMVRDLFRMITF